MSAWWEYFLLFEILSLYGLAIGATHMAILSKFSDEDFRYLVSNSINGRDLVEKLGLKQGGSYNRVLKRVHMLGCDTNHWIKGPGLSWSKGLIDPTKCATKAEKYLCKNGKTSISSNILKIKCLKEGLLDNVCYECGLCPEWENQRLVLHLDHINGDKYDNRLENLRILCPNCHSQTDNYCNKNPMRYHKGKKNETP
jgi:hypothetical protein